MSWFCVCVRRFGFRFIGLLLARGANSGSKFLTFFLASAIHKLPSGSFFGSSIALYTTLGRNRRAGRAEVFVTQGALLAAEKKSSAGWVFIVILLLLVGGGVAAWLMLDEGPSAQASKSAKPNGVPKYLVHLEGFTVNLADPEETHFLRVTMDLGIDRLPDGVDKEKASAALPVGRIRDAILSVLTTCKADALLTAEGKATLKKNLVESLNRAVPELSVREVYFTEFLVQR
jgi:flagellar protein FliL